MNIHVFVRFQLFGHMSNLGVLRNASGCDFLCFGGTSGSILVVREGPGNRLEF